MGIRFCICSILLMQISILVESAPRIHSPWGDIVGVDKNTTEGLTYFGYYGIPYAKPPIDDLRFCKPEPHPGFMPATFNAGSYGKICMQTISGKITYNNPIMNEDCLTLNVFLPSDTTNTSSKSVMVYIHGGGFTYMYASFFEPWKLVSTGDVIVVTIQYRLGFFGFGYQSTGDNEVKVGNNGLWDQHLALQWVKKNIGAFGGNNDDITIEGESAGAASVAYHLLYPGSTGLFHRAVLQSGAATSLWAFKRETGAEMDQLLEFLHCDYDIKNVTKMHEEIIQCFRTANSSDLLFPVIAGVEIGVQVMLFPWVPVIDKEFILDDPLTLMSNKSFLASTCLVDVDVMVGLNNNEGSLIYLQATALDTRLNTTFASDMLKPNTYDDDILPITLMSYMGTHNVCINAIVSELYTFPRAPGRPTLPLNEVMNTVGDPGFVVPGIQLARAHAEVGKNKRSYLYLFDHYPSFTGDNAVKGMGHGLDIPYLFGLNPSIVKLFGYSGNITKEEYELSTTFVHMIAEFVKHGNSNAIIAPKLGKQWPIYDVQTEKYLSFTNQLKVKDHLYSERISTWLDVIPSKSPCKKEPISGAQKQFNGETSILILIVLTLHSLLSTLNVL